MCIRDSSSATNQQTIALNAGCTWICFNVGTPDGTWGGLLSQDRASSNDVILGNAGSATYYSGSWYPSDPGFRPATGVMYMVRSANARNMIANGTPPGSGQPATLTSGWNWIGTSGITNLALQTLVTGAHPSDGDVIVDQSGGVATYYQGTWYSNTGGGYVIRPGYGYQIYLKNP